MRWTGILILAALVLPGCDSPPPQPQHGNLVNATQSDQAFPSTVDGNDVITGDQTASPAANGQEGSQQEPPAQ